MVGVICLEDGLRLIALVVVFFKDELVFIREFVFIREASFICLTLKC